MTIKPILFNTEMVRAILDGRKSCTRRLVKDDVSSILNSPYRKAHPEVEDKQILCKACMPPCIPGDILYVRETWFYDGSRYMYKANYSETEKFYRNGEEVKIKWHPSIHMPKEAARIWLKVKSVRVEMLQEITLEQIHKEGIKTDDPYVFFNLWNSTIKRSNLERYGWSANPWVWVISFERCEKPEDIRY